jgi:predicted nucleic acid-binding protein
LQGDKLKIFDTTFIIDLTNLDPGAVKLAAKVDGDGENVAISAITAHEYLLGVHLAYYGKAQLGQKLESAERDLSKFGILPLEGEVAETSAKIHAQLIKKGRQTGINDVYIAATAIHHGAELVSRNVKHFRDIPGLRLGIY